MSMKKSTEVEIPINNLKCQIKIGENHKNIPAFFVFSYNQQCCYYQKNNPNDVVRYLDNMDTSKSSENSRNHKAQTKILLFKKGGNRLT